MANPRPVWCPHPACKYVVSFQEKMCAGELTEPEPHGNDYNTHRMCIDTRETGHGIFDLQINSTDKYYFVRLFASMFKEAGYCEHDQWPQVRLWLRASTGWLSRL